MFSSLIAWPESLCLPQIRRPAHLASRLRWPGPQTFQQKPLLRDKMCGNELRQVNATPTIATVSDALADGTCWFCLLNLALPESASYRPDVVRCTAIRRPGDREVCDKKSRNLNL